MREFNETLRAQFENRLRELELEHRDLDAAVHRLSEGPAHDQVSLRRMKKRKLLLKDQIAWVVRQLDPDVLA